MIVRVLGSAAGGGVPQWNCECPNCAAARRGDPAVPARLQSSLAVRASGGPWFLVNASPDVRRQLDTLRETNGHGERARLRSSPVAGVLLTDPELDHTLGLAVMRESPVPLALFSTKTVERALREGFPVLEALEGYCGVEWRELVPGERHVLGNQSGKGSLEVEPFTLPGDPPLYMRGRGAEWDGYQVGLTFTDPETGGVATYAPGLPSITEGVAARFSNSDAIFVDGTFWENDEMAIVSASGRTARDMGHLPLSGEGGSLEQLAALPCQRKVLVHVNNTNPILRQGSPERRAVESAGLEVAADGLTIEI